MNIKWGVYDTLDFQLMIYNYISSLLHNADQFSIV